MADPHFAERAILVEVEDPSLGILPMHAILPRLSATPGRYRRPAPGLGEHTADLLGEAGVDPATVATLAG